MNRVARLATYVIVFAAGAVSTMVAQLPTSNMQISPVPTSQMPSSPMSVTDMSAHMKGTMANMQVVANSMQRNSEVHLLMDRMKSLGADLTQLLNRLQVLMADKTLSQDQLKMQRAQNISFHVQTMIRSVDGVVGELDQIQKGK
jgi:hypothetical protein